MELIPAKVAFISIPGFIMKNEYPKNVFDKAITIPERSKLLHYDLFRLARLNVTLVDAQSVGNCNWINNQSKCTGCLELLTSGKADFAPRTIEYESYNHMELFPNVKMGPMVRESIHVFLATSQESERDVNLNLYNIFQQFPPSALILNALILLATILLINYKLISRDKRISFLDALVLHTLRWNRKFVKLRRRLIMFFILLYCFFSHYYYSAIICSDLIITIPEHFMNSLGEVLASNRTPAMFDGHPLTREFQGSDNPIKRQLYQRAVERGSLYPFKSRVEMFDAVTRQNQVGFFYNQPVARAAQANECTKLIGSDLSGIETMPKLKMSDPYSVAHSGYMYSQSINHEVERRLNSVHAWFFESGVILMDAKYPMISIQPRDHMVACLDHMDRKRHSPDKEIQLTSQVIPVFLLGLFIGFCLAGLCFILEFLSTSIEQFLALHRNRRKTLIAKIICKINPLDFRSKKEKKRARKGNLNERSNEEDKIMTYLYTKILTIELQPINKKKTVKVNVT